jgi:hypothetical protein
MNEHRDFLSDIRGAVACNIGGQSMMGQQALCGRRVFRSDDVGFGERSESTDGEIVGVPDWHSDKRESSCLARCTWQSP